MSFPEPKLTTFKADGAIAQGKVVKIGSDRQHVAQSVLATNKNIGIANSASSQAEDPIEVALPGGGALGLAGGSISAGDFVTSDSNGALVTTTTANDKCVGQALEDASSGQLFAMSVSVFNY